MLEKWNSRTSAGDVLYRDQLLGEIKSNMVNVINDYRGLGVENEQALIDQTNTLFTGDIIPSRDDWEILNKVLLELSTVKEQGQMYQHFIQDVSDSLGISDLEKIKEFIDYIQKLPPVSATINVEMELPGFYEVTNLKVATTNNWGHADITWDLSNANLEKPKATISFNPSKSEDVSSYEIRITAGTYSQSIDRPGTDLSPHVFELDWLNWFSSSQLKSAKLTVDMDITDKRGNMTTVSQSEVYPANSIIPLGVKNYEVEYRLDSNNWRQIGEPTVKSFRHDIPNQTATYSWRVRALDKSGKYTDWATTSDLFIVYLPPAPPAPQLPPGRPEPTVTTTTTSATVRWEAVARADNYSIKYVKKDASPFDVSFFEDLGTGLVKTFTGLTPNTEYIFYVRATNSAGNTTNEVAGMTDEEIKQPPSPEPPGRPEPRITTISSSSATVRWEKVARADNYSVMCKKTNGSVSDVSFYEDLGTSRVKTFTGLTPNTEYTFYVRATNSAGNTTNEVAGITKEERGELGTPEPEVTTTATQATITWEPVENAGHYEIWHNDEDWARKNTGRDGNTYFSLVWADETLQVTHGRMNPGTTRTWYVRAVNAYDSRTGSTTATQKEERPAKPSPTVKTTVHEATISWKPVSGAEYYEVWHGGEEWAKDNTKNGNVFWSRVNAGSTLQVTHGKMNQGQEYTWYVSAVNKAGRNVGSTKATQVSNTPKTKTYWSNGTNVWRGGYHLIKEDRTPVWIGSGWRYSNSNIHNDVYQGAWHDADRGRGYEWRSGGLYQAYGGQMWGNHGSFIYFDYDTIRKDLKNKDIQSVAITLTRSGSTHGWPEGKPLYLYNHNKTKRQAAGPSGGVDMFTKEGRKVTNTNQEVTQYIKFERGQTEVIVNQNTKKLWRNIVNGDMKGLGIVYFYGDIFNSPPPVAPRNYMYFDGEIKVEVKYKDT